MSSGISLKVCILASSISLQNLNPSVASSVLENIIECIKTYINIKKHEMNEHLNDEYSLNATIKIQYTIIGIPIIIPFGLYPCLTAFEEQDMEQNEENTENLE